jgi:hypothetical protein
VNAPPRTRTAGGASPQGDAPRPAAGRLTGPSEASITPPVRHGEAPRQAPA